MAQFEFHKNIMHMKSTDDQLQPHISKLIVKMQQQPSQ